MFKYNLFLSNKFQYKIYDQLKEIIAYYKKYILASNNYQASNKHS